VLGSPVRDPGAVGLAWPGQRRIALLACDVVRTTAGGWLVHADDARVPAGLGLALAARRGITSGAPALGAPPGVPDPADALPLLRSALEAAAPPGCAGAPVVAVLGAGDEGATAAEDEVLAAAAGVLHVTPAQLWPRIDGGVAVALAGRRAPVDVLCLRIDPAELAAHRTPTGQTVGGLLTEAVRAGRLGLANAPGNAVADDLSSFAGVPAMIRFYLGEDPLLEQVPTWVLADATQWAQVRGRLRELVVVPVAAYGGGRSVVGPRCSAAELRRLQAEVAAAPHRFIAREHVETTTAPTLVEGRLLPRRVDLRLFSAATGPGETRVLDAPLTRVAVADGAPAPYLGAGVKDTWLLP
jgi:carboxylate-amine ligase